MSVPIKDWPAGERPREKLLALGAAALSEAELLAVFLRTGIAGHDVLENCTQRASSLQWAEWAAWRHPR